MNCPKCGSVATQDVIFCGTCGANMKTAVTSGGVAQQSQSVQSHPPSSSYGTAQAPAVAPQPEAMGAQRQGVSQPNATGNYGPPQVAYYPQTSPQVQAPLQYAEFMSRFFALLVDEIIAIVIAGMAWGAFFAISLLIGGLSGGGSGAIAAGFVSLFLGGTVGLLTYIAYFVKLETSPAQATFGKRMMGMKICNSQGGRISVGQSLGRLIVKNSFSALFFMMGFLMAAFTEKKQSLHDFVASTFVVKA